MVALWWDQSSPVVSETDIFEPLSQAWNRGMGAWPQAPVRKRIEAVLAFAAELQANREQIVNILMCALLTSFPLCSDFLGQVGDLQKLRAGVC